MPAASVPATGSAGVNVPSTDDRDVFAIDNNLFGKGTGRDVDRHAIVHGIVDSRLNTWRVSPSHRPTR